MRKQLEQVKEFSEAFGFNVSEKPQVRDLETALLRFKLMSEENREFMSAAIGVKPDLVEVADACGDMLYVLCGTILEYGLQDKIEMIFDEIHRSNMSKRGGGKDKNGKAMKGENYFKPELASIIKSEEDEKK